MSILNNILKGTANDLTKSIGEVIDQVVTTDAEKLEAKAKLTDIVTSKLSEMAQAQKEVIIAELTGNTLQRNWRPIVMLMFALIVVYSKFIAPAFGLPNAELEPDFWGLLEIGLGGYVVGRSLEKITSKVTNNIDLSFVKRKNRKL